MLANEGNVSFLIGFEVVLPKKKKKLFWGYSNMQIFSPLPQKGFLGQIIIMVIPRKTALWVTHDPSSLLRKEAR